MEPALRQDQGPESRLPTEASEEPQRQQAMEGGCGRSPLRCFKKCKLFCHSPCPTCGGDQASQARAQPRSGTQGPCRQPRSLPPPGSLSVSGPEVPPGAPAFTPLP